MDAEEEKDNKDSKLKEEKQGQSKWAKFLVMMTKLTDVLGSSAPANRKPESGGGRKKRKFQQWRYENPDNKKTKMNNNLQDLLQDLTKPDLLIVKIEFESGYTNMTPSITEFLKIQLKYNFFWN